MTSSPSRLRRGGSGWVAVFGERSSDSVAEVRIGSDPATRPALWLVSDEGNRPAVVEKNRVAMVFSGRLYDVDRLRGGLSAPGLRALRDADLALELYLEGRADGLGALRGIFTLIIWDADRDLLLAMRDPLGYSPLFFAERTGQLMLALTEEALLQQGVSAEINRLTAAGWACSRFVNDEQTLFSAIRRVRPGCRLEVTAGGAPHEIRYWHPAVPNSPDPLSPDVAQEEFDALLVQAVGRALSWGRAGVLLSGGIDSTTIAAVAVSASRERSLPEPCALSLQFPDPESDESDAQRYVARTLGIPHVIVPFHEAFGEDGPLIEGLKLCADVATPPGGPWASAYDRLAAEAVSRGCAVILGGDWSEWFRASWEYAADLIRSGDVRALHEFVRAEARYYRSPYRRTARELVWRHGARLLALGAAASALGRLGATHHVVSWRVRRSLRRVPAWIAPDPELRRELAEGWIAAAPDLGWGSMHSRRLENMLVAPDMTVPMDWYQLQSRRWGVPFVEPFQDPDLIEFSLRLPGKLLNAGGRVKGLAAQSVSRRAPTLDLGVLRVAWYESVFRMVMEKEGAGGIEYLGGLPLLSRYEIVDPAPLLAAVEAGDLSGNVSYNHVWYAMALEAWLQARIGV